MYYLSYVTAVGAAWSQTVMDTVTATRVRYLHFSWVNAFQNTEEVPLRVMLQTALTIGQDANNFTFSSCLYICMLQYKTKSP